MANTVLLAISLTNPTAEADVIFFLLPLDIFQLYKLKSVVMTFF